MYRNAYVSVAALVFAAGCVSETVSGPDGSGAGGSAPQGDWITLIDANWSMAAGDEGYHCALKTLDEDMYVGVFEGIAPQGTHHTVLSLTDTDQPDGDFACGAGTLSDEMVFASGVGSNDLTLPSGVAFKLPKGRKMLLNLHLFNTGTATLAELSGVRAILVPASQVEQEAESIFAGTVLIGLSPMSEGEAIGSCRFQEDATLISVWPHMHQYGTHMKVVHEGAEGQTTIHDADYAFEEQINYDIEPRLVRGGDRIYVTCSYQNTSSQTISFGDSSTQEMCFAGLYRYPAARDGLFCDLPGL
jgi:hypothetical protein